MQLKAGLLHKMLRSVLWRLKWQKVI